MSFANRQEAFSAMKSALATIEKIDSKLPADLQALVNKCTKIVADATAKKAGAQPDAIKAKDYGEAVKVRVLTYTDDCMVSHTQLELLHWGNSDPATPPNTWTLTYGIRVDRYNFVNGSYQLIDKQDNQLRTTDERRAWQYVQNNYAGPGSAIDAYNDQRGRTLDGGHIPNVSILGNKGAYYVTVEASVTPIAMLTYQPLVTDIDLINNRFSPQGVVNLTQNLRPMMIKMQSCGQSYTSCDISTPNLVNGINWNAAMQNLLALSFQQTISNLFNSLNISLPIFNFSVNQGGFGVQLY